MWKIHVEKNQTQRRLFDKPCETDLFHSEKKGRGMLPVKEVETIFNPFIYEAGCCEIFQTCGLKHVLLKGRGGTFERRK